MMSNELARENKETKAPGVANYYAGLAVDIILLYALNNIRYLNSSILIKEEYISCLWAINLALGIGIMGNFFLLLYRPTWFYHLVQGILNALVLLAFYVIFQIFPLNISNNTILMIFKIILIVIMAGVGIGFIVEAFKFITSLIHREKPPLPPITPEPPAVQ